MGDKSKIEWTDATLNVATGCTKVSPGCAHCYIERTPPFRIAGRKFDSNGHIPIQLHPERLSIPLHWKRPRRVFVNSLSDLFHEDIPDSFLDKVFYVMMATQQHTYQVLTKRPERMLAYCGSEKTAGRLIAQGAATAMEVSGVKLQVSKNDDGLTGVCLPNVWLGVTAENQSFAEERIPLLLQTPAAVRFVSYEPALSEIDFRPYLVCRCGDYKSHHENGTGPCRMPNDLTHGFKSCKSYIGIDWVICGGESGPGARPMHPDWARSVRDQCRAAGVAFHFKQWGEYRPTTRTDGIHESPFGGQWMTRVGKKRAGRLLDGREWNQYPRPA